MDMTVREIKAAPVGDAVGAVLYVQGAELKTGKNNTLYWNLELKDGTGSVVGKIWKAENGAYGDLAQGRFVRIHGKADAYGGTPQVIVEQLAVLSEQEAASLDQGRFGRTSARTGEAMMKDLEQMFRKVLVHKPWRDFVGRVLRDDALRDALMRAPGAVSVHHAYPGGLLEHTLSVCRNCMVFADLYPGLDRQILLVAAAFHDIGKTREYAMVGLSPTRTDEGALIGHIALGMEMLGPALAASGLDGKLKEHFRHLIVSHHGRLDYGSPAVPMTAEAFALHFADDLDAKMNQMEALFDADTPEGTWTPWMRLFDRAMLKAARTPEDGQQPTRRSSAKADSGQCSLL